MMKTLRSAVMAAVLGCGAVLAGEATAATVMTGDTVTCSGACSPGSATVGGDVEFRYVFPFFPIPAVAFDFSEGFLTITGLVPSAGFADGFTPFTFTNTTNAFASATIVSSDAVLTNDDEALPASRVSVTNGVLSVDLGGTRVFNEGSLTVALTVANAAVPEPATWLTMTLGMAAVGGALRRRRRLVAAA